MLAQAISNTSPETVISSLSPLPNSACILAIPAPPGVNITCDFERFGFWSAFL